MFDLTGNCVACIDDSDCASSDRCSLSPVEGVPTLGGYTVTVAPRFYLDVLDPPVVVTFNFGVTACSKACTLPKSNQAATYTF